MNHQDSMSGNEPEQKPLIDDDVKKNVKSRNTWLRFFYMLLFVVIMGLAELILAAVVIVQFFTVLLSGERNSKLLSFAADMSRYVFDIWKYLSFVTEEQPFPFGDWREAESGPTGGSPDASSSAG